MLIELADFTVLAGVGYRFAVPAHAIYWRGAYQGIDRYHRPIDPTVFVWCYSIRALCIDGIESHARQRTLPNKDPP